MEENKKYLLSTRPIDQLLVHKAAELDIVIHSISFIKTSTIINDQLKARIDAAASEPLTVVFTSMNAVDAVGGYMQGKVPEWQVFSLGTATRKVVEHYFGDGKIVGTAADASSLAEEIIRNDVKNVVFFCGDQRRDELPEKLAGHNIHVEEVVVYNTLPLPLHVEKKYEGILFFSPSAVESFFSANTVSVDTVLFAIGNTTANSIRQFSNNTVVESDFPGKANLVEKAISYLSKSNHPNEHIKK